jgi:hypothetical protein
MRSQPPGTRMALRLRTSATVELPHFSTGTLPSSHTATVPMNWFSSDTGNTACGWAAVESEKLRKVSSARTETIWRYITSRTGTPVTPLNLTASCKR